MEKSEIVVPILDKMGSVRGNRPQAVAVISGQKAKTVRVIAHVPSMGKYDKREGVPRYCLSEHLALSPLSNLKNTFKTVYTTFSTNST